MKKILLIGFFIFSLFSSDFLFSQTINRWYQDGIVVFQLKTSGSYTIASRNKIVDMDDVDFISSMKDKYGIYEMTQLHPTDKDPLLKKTYQVKFSHFNMVEDVISMIAKHPLIEYAEKKELHEHFLTPNDLGLNATNTSGTSPTTNQWSLHKINAQLAWNLSIGSSTVKVAITDNAIKTTHPDLVNKIVATYDAPTGGTNANPCGSNDGSHGSHVSGTVGAQTNNGTGVSSIGSNISIMAVKIGSCTGSLTHGYEGINWAANNGANVINMSWGGGGSSTYGQNVCNAAFNAGSILVAAAGNDGTNQQFYPAAYNNIISVASTTTTDAKSSFSQYGTWIKISAPGSSIRSCDAGTGYQSLSGTSMASPHVAGLLGLMKSYVPTASNQDIINCLYSSADDISSVNSGYTGQLGAGRINAYQALVCLGAFNVANDAGILEIGDPSNAICASNFTPVVTLKNFGSNLLTTVTINYSWNGNSFTFPWTGSLASGQTVLVTLPLQTGVTGSYTFNASTSTPNNIIDQNLTNDGTSSAFSLAPNGQTVNLSLITDCYGSEITWNIKNANNTVVISGGPYTDVAGGQTFNLPLCMGTGCYTFNIFDSYGDGLYGGQSQNCSVNGNYYLKNANGDTLFNMTAVNANFGSSTSHSFCIIPPSLLNDAGISQIVSPLGFLCDASIVPIVQIRNYGSNPLISATITYNTGGSSQTYNWTGNLGSGLSQNVTLPSIPVGSGQITITASTSLPNNVADADNLNNQSTQTIVIYTNGLPLPFTETFENNPFTNGTWTLRNPDNEYTWEIATIIGTSPGTKAAKMNFFQYAQSSRRDGMITPKLNLTGYSSALMTFEHAYRRFDQSTSDSLIIYVSTDCGLNFTRVFARGENGTGTFASATTSTVNFTPASSNEWCMGTIGADCFSVNLDAFVGQQILVLFEGFNSGTIGNNLFVDNVNITGVLSQTAPTPGFVASTQTVCVGSQVTFTDQSSANATQWSWVFTGGTPSSSPLQNPVITYNTPGNYPVTLTASNSFGSNSTTQTNFITVQNAPAVTATANPVTICAGSSAVLSGGGANTYSWAPSTGLTATTGSQVTANPTAPITYTVTGTSACGTATATLSLTVFALPAAPVIVQNANVLSIILPQNHTAQWYLNGSSINAATGATYTISQNGNYTVTITDANGCSITSVIFNAIANSIEILEPVYGFDYTIYPNPGNGLINISINTLQEPVELRVMDLLSKEVRITNLNKILQSGIYQIDLSDQSPGVYFLCLKSNKGVIMEKVVIQR